WAPLRSEGASWPGRVGAVDGGMIRFRLDNGGSLVAVSAIGIGEGFEEREVDCAVLYPPHRDYSSLLMRRLELRVARKVVERVGAGGLLLLDGSLYGLLSHIPVTPTVAPNGYGSLLIDFYSELAGLLEDSSRTGVWLVSVSKSSSSSFLRDYALSILYRREIERLRELNILESGDLQMVETLLYKLFRSPLEAVKLVKSLEARYGHFIRRIELIVREGLVKTPDLLLLKRYTDGVGSTEPLLLGPSSRLRDLYELALRDSLEYTARRLLLPEEEAGKVRDVLQRLVSVPAVASLYVRLSSSDYPLKIDVTASILGVGRRYFDAGETPEKVEGVNVQQLIAALKNMYGGREVYNIWLYEADRRARLRRHDSGAIIEVLGRRVGGIGLARRPLMEF
ncbi:MAG: DNA double-strand break repair nuclease NurA, partial [Nitrososphaerota archaeon]